MNRDEFCLLDLKPNVKILEFGPSYGPMYSKRDGYNVKIVDHCSAEELRKNGYTASNNIEKIEEVDYVCSSDYYNYITSHGGGKFDLIAASHVIEHTVDLIQFFKDISLLIKPDGIIKLVIPDKRYEFDCFRETTSIRVAMDTHLNRGGKKIHSQGVLIDAYFSNASMIYTPENSYIPNSVPIYPSLVEFGFEVDENQISSINSCLKDYDKNTYIDVHSWVFTPKSFEILIIQLNLIGYIDLIIDKIFKEDNEIQFYVQLKKGKYVFDKKKLKELYIEHKMEELESYRFWHCIEEWKILGKNIFIYGCGNGADLTTKILSEIGVDITGYVVSDGRREVNKFNEKQVYELSELDDQKDEVAFVIGVLNPDFKHEITELLKIRNYRNVL